MAHTNSIAYERAMGWQRPAAMIARFDVKWWHCIHFAHVADCCRSQRQQNYTQFSMRSRYYCIELWSGPHLRSERATFRVCLRTILVIMRFVTFGAVPWEQQCNSLHRWLAAAGVCSSLRNIACQSAAYTAHSRHTCICARHSIVQRMFVCKSLFSTVSLDFEQAICQSSLYHLLCQSFGQLIVIALFTLVFPVELYFNKHFWIATCTNKCGDNYRKRCISMTRQYRYQRMMMSKNYRYPRKSYYSIKGRNDWMQWWPNNWFKTWIHCHVQLKLWVELLSEVWRK